MIDDQRIKELVAGPRPVMLTARVTCSDGFWMIVIPELDAFTQATNLAGIEYMTKDIAALVTQIPVEQFTVHVEPDPDWVMADSFNQGDTIYSRLGWRWDKLLRRVRQRSKKTWKVLEQAQKLIEEGVTWEAIVQATCDDLPSQRVSITETNLRDAMADAEVEPLIVTDQGQPRAVILSMTAFTGLLDRLEDAEDSLAGFLTAGEDVIPAEQVYAELDAQAA
ncbi:MAG: type II toxin-antitoxin system Phd/YefM family antitoxin [Propionibacteriaceae bacterium]|nr:type II toxin-antitoxin system Phd/YefM family antitoxin [Propionibacteriaceae bacterium]